MLWLGDLPRTLASGCPSIPSPLSFPPPSDTPIAAPPTRALHPLKTRFIQSTPVSHAVRHSSPAQYATLLRIPRYKSHNPDEHGSTGISFPAAAPHASFRAPLPVPSCKANVESNGLSAILYLVAPVLLVGLCYGPAAEVGARGRSVSMRHLDLVAPGAPVASPRSPNNCIQSNRYNTVHTPNSNCTAIHHGHQPRLAQAVHDRRLVSRGRPPCPRCSWMALLTGRPSPSPHCSDSGDFECERRPRHARLARMHPCYAPAWPCPSHLSCCSCSSPFARSPARSLVRLARSGSPGGLRTAVAAISGGEGGPS